jgi:RNA polymerase sigma factor (sigma-70 family)
MILATDPSLSRFLDEASDHDILTAREEMALLRMAQAGSAAAKRRLCAQNMKFVISVARLYKHVGVPMSDLIGEGVQGLYKAIQAYNPAAGYRFTSYAVWWVRQAMTTAINEKSRTIRITAEHEAPIRKLRRSSPHQVIGGDYVEDLEGVAKAHRIPPRNLLASLRAASLGLRIGPTDGDGSTGEILPSAAPSPEEDAHTRDRIAILNRLRGKLTPIQREIVTLVYGLDDRAPLTLREIGIRLTLSHERIRQIRNDALARMKTLARQYREKDD